MPARIRALSIVWFIYGGLSLALSLFGLAFANAFFHGPMRGHMVPGRTGFRGRGFSGQASFTWHWLCVVRSVIGPFSPDGG